MEPSLHWARNLTNNRPQHGKFFGVLRSWWEKWKLALEALYNCWQRVVPNDSHEVTRMVMYCHVIWWCLDEDKTSRDLRLQVVR
jgi:hypothetical protein